jgi:hypothetical protein
VNAGIFSPSATVSALSTDVVALEWTVRVLDGIRLVVVRNGHGSGDGVAALCNGEGAYGAKALRIRRDEDAHRGGRRRMQSNVSDMAYPTNPTMTTMTIPSGHT